MSETEVDTGGLGHAHRRARRPEGMGRLRRSRSSRIGGVSAGVAEFVGVSPRPVRILWLVSLPLSGGLTALAYLLLWALLPAPDGRRASGAA